MSEQVPTIKKNDLYVYDLAPAVLQSLQLLGFDGSLNESIIDTSKLPPLKKDETKVSEPVELDHTHLKNKKISTSLYCNICRVAFETRDQQRQHYQSDLHNANVKRGIKGFEPLSSLDQDLTTLKEDKEDDEEEEEEEEEEEKESDESEENELITQLEEVNISSQDPSSTFLNTQLPLILFDSSYTHTLKSKLDSFGIYKVLFDSDELVTNPWESLQLWNDATLQSDKFSALFMVGGGHFAGAIISHQKRNGTKPMKSTESLQEQNVIMLEHKTFHRYTTRRKQGGSQSAMDNAKGKANSAGSSLRRYNEMALKQDIQNLLIEWKPYLDKCENIYIRARSVYDKRIFFDPDNNNNHNSKNTDVISKNDKRVKNFPFTTGRPTMGEIKKAWCELTYLKPCSKPKPIITVTKPKTTNQNVNKTNTNKGEKTLTVEEKQSDELVQLVKKARAPLIAAYLRKNKLDVNFPLKPESKYYTTPTLLHYASQQGIKQMIIILLSNMKADPTLKNHLGKTAADLNKSVTIKQAFQIARHNLGEDFTNWDDAHVDEPLSREQVDEINNKKEEQEKLESQALMKKEADAAKERQRLEKESAREKSFGKGNTLNGNAPAMSIEQNLNSLTEEQRRRLMREQRARAAEARMGRNA